MLLAAGVSTLEQDPAGVMEDHTPSCMQQHTISATFASNMAFRTPPTTAPMATTVELVCELKQSLLAADVLAPRVLPGDGVADWSHTQQPTILAGSARNTASTMIAFEGQHKSPYMP